MELNSNRADVISRMQSRMVTIDQFNWEHLMAPPLYSLITQDACNRIHQIATSVRYSGNARKRYELIDEVLKPFGFEKKGAGTNRVVYKYLENDSFLLKVATDAVGIGDNPREFKNQFIFKPFVTKIFEVDPTGAVALVERIVPITSREEFLTCASEVYDVIREWFIGDYIMADIGTKFFMNWGIRRGFGPVLLDFPYVYELDGNKLFCNEDYEGIRCGGEIDYDDGYNFLYCQKCGKRYRVQQLAKAATEQKIIVKGRASRMKIEMTFGGKVVKSNNVETVIEKAETDCIKKVRKPSTPQVPTGDKLKVVAGMVEKPAPKPKRDDKNNNKHTTNGVNNRGIVRANDSETPSTDNSSAAIIKELEEKLKALQDKYDQQSDQLKSVYDDYDIMEGYKEKACKEKAEVEKKLAELQEEHDKLQESYDELEEKYDDKCNEDNTEDLEAKVEELEKKLAEKDEEIKSLSEKADKSDEESFEDLEAKVEELEKKLADTESKLNSTNRELESANNTKNDLEYQSNNLKTKVNDLVNQFNEEKKVLEDENNNLKTELEGYKSNYDKLVTDNEQLKDTIVGLESHIRDIDTTSSSSVELPVSTETLLREEGREEYADNIRSADGINPLIGELTTINSINLSANNPIVEQDQYVIAISTEEGEYLTDQEGNVLCIYCVDNIQVPEVFKNDRKFYDTENKVKLINVNGGNTES